MQNIEMDYLECVYAMLPLLDTLYERFALITDQSGKFDGTVQQVDERFMVRACLGACGAGDGRAE